MSNIVLSVENLWKHHGLGVVGVGSLREDVNRWLAKLRGKEDPSTKLGETNDRENIFLNWAILGMTKNGIRRKFDEV